MVLFGLRKEGELEVQVWEAAETWSVHHGPALVMPLVLASR